MQCEGAEAGENEEEGGGETETERLLGGAATDPETGTKAGTSPHLEQELAVDVGG